MKAIEFKEQNFKLLAGNNPNTYDMPACKAINQEGTRFIIGKFELSEDERERFLETGELFVCVIGGGWPPMLPTTLNPFKELGFKQDKPVRGIPNVKYKKEIEQLLKDIFWNKSMTEEYWIDFLEGLAQTCPFQETSNNIEAGIIAGRSKEDCLKMLRDSYLEALAEKVDFLNKK